MEQLREDILDAYKKLMNWPSKDVLLIFHDDADGITSGAIAYETLRRLGCNVNLVCIEKLMTQIINYIHSTEGRIIFYVDIGSPHADKISKVNNSKNLVIILDHHDPSRATDPLVFNINPEFYGMEGERDASGSIMTYIFSKTIDSKNIDLAPIAVIGAQEIPSEPRGLILEAMKDADKLGKKLDYKNMFRILQILGPVGYYQNGPIDGIKVCLEGLSKEYEEKAKLLEESRRKANKRMLAVLYRRGLNKTKHIQWFDSYNIYEGMGTKVIGTFCSFLSFQKKLIDPNRYILGIMPMPNEIPGLMKLEGSWIKISLRAPDNIRRKIDLGSYPGLGEIIVDLSEELGGTGDGHKYAASAAIPSNKKLDFITELDEEIDQNIK